MAREFAHSRAIHGADLKLNNLLRFFWKQLIPDHALRTNWMIDPQVLSNTQFHPSDCVSAIIFKARRRGMSGMIQFTKKEYDFWFTVTSVPFIIAS